MVNKKSKGNLPARGPGRPKGARNKTTVILKEAILMAAEKAGKGSLVNYLTAQAEANPGAFLPLLGKVLPLQVEGTEGGIPVVFKTVYEERR